MGGCAVASSNFPSPGHVQAFLPNLIPAPTHPYRKYQTSAGTQVNAN